MRTDLNRLLGAATTLYSVAIMAKPQWFAKPCGLPLEPDGTTPRGTGALIRAIGARDTAIGLAMVAATGSRARRSVTWCRVAADVSDAVVFGSLLDKREPRLKVAGFALSWAALCALSLRGTQREPHP
ncbi:DUF4267 domain-containing protein [Streptomyces sp. NPDC002795]|uniref:DUF4267 domain-containing protein n=1 Tax=Streptomyces sp. NPDC002795 TaxID=3364665 RepID=UPI0036771BE3